MSLPLFEDQPVDRAAVRRVPPHREPIIQGDIAILPLTCGQVAIIDAADVPLVTGRCWYAHWNPKGNVYYAVRNGSKINLDEPRRVYLHRLLLGFPANLDVDHRNHDGLDNRRANLRLATRSENQANRRGPTSRNTGGYLGVHPTRSGRWAAKVTVNQVDHYIGTFATADEGATARENWLRRNHPSEFRSGGAHV